MTALGRAAALTVAVLFVAAMARPVEWFAAHPIVAVWAAIVAILAGCAAVIYDTARPR